MSYSEIPHPRPNNQADQTPDWRSGLKPDQALRILEWVLNEPEEPVTPSDRSADRLRPVGRVQQ